MGVLLDWFAHGDTLEKDIAQELILLGSLLEDILDAETVLQDKEARKKNLKSILKVKKGKITQGLKLQEKIEKKLQPYLDGKKRTRNLARILMLQMLLRDLQNDQLWKDLQRLWAEEYALLDSDDEVKLRSNLYEQQYIAKLLKKIIELELNETHMHFDTSADPDFHWLYLKKLWEAALKEKALPEKNIIRMYEGCAREGSLDKKDLRKIKKIMAAFFSGEWTEVKAFVEFEKLVLMAPEDVGCFHGFNKKAEILNVIELAASETGGSVRRNYFLGVLDNIAKHNLDHNVTHIEIRFPSAYFQSLEFMADIAREIEQKHNNKITIRFIEFITRDKDPQVFYDAYTTAPRWIQKYFVAVDLIARAAKGTIQEDARKSPLPLCVHAGEFFSEKDYPGKTAVERVELALNQINACVESLKIHRIGHANVLGINIPEFLKGAPSKEVKRLDALQKKLIRAIKRKGIIIEANPTSNVLIRGITYEEHPIAAFQEHNIPFAISTDDRVSFDTNLKKEFYRIARAMKWKEREIELVAQMQNEAKLK